MTSSMYMKQRVQGLQIFGLGRATLLIQVNWMFCINISEIWTVSLGFFFLSTCSILVLCQGPGPDPVLTRGRDLKETSREVLNVYIFISGSEKGGKCIAETAQRRVHRGVTRMPGSRSRPDIYTTGGGRRSRLTPKRHRRFALLGPRGPLTRERRRTAVQTPQRPPNSQQTGYCVCGTCRTQP